MKKVLVLSIILIFLTCSHVFAYPFLEVEGFVIPVGGTDNGNGTTTFSRIDYSFTIKTADMGAKMNFFSLEFERDVFQSIGTISGINPGDWLTGTITSSSGNIYQFNSAGTTLGAGETLSFSMLNVIVYNEALLNPTLWQEGKIWGQSWAVGDTLGGREGGSTAVPEPATIFLMGSGLFGMGLVLKKKLIK